MLDDLPVARWELKHLPQPSLLARFDWLLYKRYVRMDVERPRSIWAFPSHKAFGILRAVIEHNSSRLSHRPALAVGGSDRWASHRRHFGFNDSWITSSFRVTYWEAMNVMVRGLRPLPTLFNDRYVSAAGGSMEVAANKHPAVKTRWLQASWGAFQPQLDSSPNVRDRGWAAAWVAAHANQSWLNGSRLQPADFFEELTKYRFSLCPSGMGVRALPTSLPHPCPRCSRTKQPVPGWPIY